MEKPSELRNALAEKLDADEGFRARFRANPRAVLAAEFGVQVPEEVEVQLHEDAINTVHVVLPSLPRGEKRKTDIGDTICRNGVRVRVTKLDIYGQPVRFVELYPWEK